MGRIRRRRWLARVALASAWLAAACSCGRDAIHHTHTNVLWITVCTLRADHLGTYGYPDDVSPTIDALASRGVLFERTLTAAPFTRPSIASMITSAYPRSLGFQEPVPWERRRLALPASAVTLAERLREAGYATFGVTANPNVNPGFQFGQGYDAYRGTEEYWHQGYEQHKMTADDVAAQLLEQLRGPLRERKLFAHLVLADVHVPYDAQTAAERLGGWQASGPHPEYALQVRYVDTVLAELLEELEALGLRDTLLILNSDHGEGFGDVRPEDVFHGSHLYDSTLWVPLLLHHPALEPRRVDQIVQNVDVVPTVLDLLGVPFEPESMAGRSLVPAIRGRSLLPRPFDVVEVNFVDARKSAVLRNAWKLIVHYDADDIRGVELYHTTEDPTESTNVAFKHPRRVRRFTALLTEWQRRYAPAAPAPMVEPSAREREALRALGYAQPD